MAKANNIKSTYTVSERNFNRQEWDYLTRSRDPYTKAVATMLRNTGEQIGEKGKYSPDNLNVKTFGIDNDKYLDALRPTFLDTFGKHFVLKTSEGKKNILELNKVETVEDSSLPKSKKGKKNKKTHGKGQALKAKIKMETLMKTIVQDCETMKNITFKNGMFPLTHNFSNIEFRLLSFMMWAFHEKVQKLKSRGDDDNYYEAVLALAHGIKSFEMILQNVRDTEVKTSITSLLLDANHILNFVVKSHFNISFFFTNYGRLITKTKYEDAYLTTIIQPYKNQTDVLTLLSNAVKKDNPCLIRARTPPGSGKTCLAVPIGAMLSKISDKILIYGCYNNLVRQDVGNQLHISGVPFAVVSSNSIRPVRLCYGGIKHRLGKFKDSLPEDPIESMKIQYNFFKKKEICPNPPKVMICDLESTLTFMSLPNFSDKFVAFLDEPTVGAERGTTNSVCVTYTRIMANLPKQSILVSATMPEFDEIKPVVQNWMDEYKANENNCHDVTSQKLGVGCKAIDKDGYIVAPHNLIRDVGQLGNLIEHLKKNSFLLRFYTAEILMDMINKVSDVFNLEETFSDIVHSISHDNIRMMCMKILKHVYDQNNEDLVKKLVEKTTRVRNVGFDIDSALTTSAVNNIGSMLYVSSTPDTDLLRMSKGLFDGAPNLDKVYSKFMKDIETYKKTMERIEKNIKQDDKQMAEKERVPIPSLKWPLEYVVNTREHLKKFSPGSRVDRTMLKHKYIDVNKDLFDCVLEPYDKLLVSGVGIYNPNDTRLNCNGSLYTNTVNKYASEGDLAVLASDEQIVYGTNYPLTCITIEEEFGKRSSQNTIGQLIGRAGRAGKSEVATVIFTDDETLNKAFTDIDKNTEALVISQIMTELMN